MSYQLLFTGSDDEGPRGFGTEKDALKELEKNELSEGGRTNLEISDLIIGLLNPWCPGLEKTMTSSAKKRQGSGSVGAPENQPKGRPGANRNDQAIA